MDKIALGSITRWTGGKLNRENKLPVKGAVIDSRRAFKGSLFFCLRGKKNDGHNYIDEVRKKGGYTIGETKNCDIEVSSSTQALWQAARGYRKSLNITTIGITGSSGKTTTVGLTEKILKNSYKVKASPKSFNNEIGVPVTLLNIKSDTELGVFELGANHRGEIDKLSRLIEPRVGVITNISDAHIGYFGSYKDIFETKFELADNIIGEGLLVYNYDQPDIRGKVEELNIKNIGFGFKKGADVRGSVLNRDPECSRFQVENKEYILKIPGQFNIYNALAGIVIGQIFKIPQELLQKRVEKFVTRSHRMKKIKLSGIDFIDDSYNSNPTAVKSLFEDMVKIYPSKKIIAVIGQMRELGKYASDLHRQTGKFISELNNVHYVLASGKNGRELIQGAKEGDVKAENIYRFNTKKTAADIIKKVSSKDSVVVLKASRKEKFEKILEEFK